MKCYNNKCFAEMEEMEESYLSDTVSWENRSGMPYFEDNEALLIHYCKNSGKYFVFGIEGENFPIDSYNEALNRILLKVS